MARIINLHSAFINREMKAILDQIFIACNALRVWNYSKREKEKGKKGILSDKLGMAELCVYRRAQVVQWSGRRWKIFRKYVLDSSRITIGKVDARGRGGGEGRGRISATFLTIVIALTRHVACPSSFFFRAFSPLFFASRSMLQCTLDIVMVLMFLSLFFSSRNNRDSIFARSL